jgi:hypothetical protein
MTPNHFTLVSLEGCAFLKGLVNTVLPTKKYLHDRSVHPEESVLAKFMFL